MKDNPLSGYFRRPAIHLKLPTNGRFYPAGSIEMPETGELPVYPMTALDEITYKTPDALFNGSALVDVIKSCVPAIIDPWMIPQDDLTAILAAIRIASFGHDLDIDTTCPKCQEHSTYRVDLRNVLDNIVTPNYDNSYPIGDIKVYFKPLTYQDINNNSKINFEEEQLAKMVNNAEMSEEEKLAKLSEAFKKVSNYTLETIVKNIDRIVTPDASVDNSEYILDFLKHCERTVYDGIKKNIVTKRASTDLKPIKVQCDNEKCKHKYNQPFTMDMSSFFE